MQKKLHDLFRCKYKQKNRTKQMTVPISLEKVQIYLVFRSVCTTFELRSKVLSLEKVQINLAFYSLIRTFAA